MIVKRFIKLSICAVLCLSIFVGCDNKNESLSGNTTPATSENGAPDTSAEQTASLPEESSVPEDSATASSEPEKPAVIPSADAIRVGTHTVNDPNNSRGLSTKKVGYGFGVAKNGQPNSISVNNQKYFDSVVPNTALALDTVSEEKCMYLTFDCGYEYQGVTGKILDVLKDKNVKATFFCTLSYLKQNPEFVRRMIDEGHAVGNHSATHPVFPDISRQKMAEEIYRVEDYLRTEFGYESKYFRYPTGAYSENSLELVASMGYKSIFWSVAYADWDTENQKGADTAYKTVTDRYHPGAVILLHAVSKDNAEALGRMIDKASSDGYALKALDEYFK